MNSFLRLGILPRCGAAQRAGWVIAAVWPLLLVPAARLLAAPVAAAPPPAVEGAIDAAQAAAAPAAGESAPALPAPVPAAEDEGGLAFDCDAHQLPALRTALTAWLSSLGIPPDVYRVRQDGPSGPLHLVLDTPLQDHATVDLGQQPRYRLHDEVIALPGRKGLVRHATVSRAEIALALMQHGRQTRFAGAACSLDALRDHVGIRQLIVAWADHLEWVFPEGDPAYWNRALWDHGTPRHLDDLEHAFRDAFLHQEKYSIGCYTAAKLVVTQAVLDYYSRVHRDPLRLALVRRRLLADRDPLVAVEPAGMWFFEEDFDPATLTDPGKLLGLRQNVAPHNFIPGDWAYFVNTDPVSRRKTGYEGSNAIYLGRGWFDDFYDDNHYHYTYRQKLDEVYQWRHGVFSRRRDSQKIEPFTDVLFQRAALQPEQGGLVLGYRAVPWLFGYEKLPDLKSSAP